MTGHEYPACIARDDVLVFRSEEVNFSMREIWKAPSVVKVEVCYHDVSNIPRPESKLTDLLYGSFLGVAGTAQGGEE